MLKRKMLRDINDYKVQFISIFLMAFIGVFVFTGMYAEANGFETTIENYYEETNLADGWIYSNYLVDELIHHIYALGATNQLERQLVIDSQANLDNKPDIQLHFVENNTISKFYLIEGNQLDINDKDGVWLDKSFADARNLKVGDTISFESNGVTITKTIRGLGYSPEYVSYLQASSTVPHHNSTGFAYLSHNAFPSDNITYNVLNVKFSGSPETYNQLLDYRIGGYYTEFIEKSNHYSVDIVSESITQQNSLSSVFPTIFIIISMLMLLTTMKRIISNQRTQIGILKAIGLKNYKITLNYLLPGTLIVIIGSTLGAIMGPYIFHMIANPSRIYYYTFPYWNSIQFIEIAIIIPFMAVLSLLVSYYSIKNIINEPASIIMKPKAPENSNLSYIEKLKKWNKLPFNFRWNYRNIKRNQFRSIMTICGIIGCTVLLLSGFALYEEINDSKEWYFNDVNHFESKITIDENANLSQINPIAQKVEGKPIMESSIEISKNNTEIASLLVLNDTDLITITDDNHNRIKINDNEVSISHKIADRLNISIGDTIDCHVVGSNKIIKIKIDSIHSSPFSQGLVMSPHKLEELGLNYTPTSIITKQHVTESSDGMKDIIYLEDLIDGWNKMEETSMIIISALIFFAVVLSLVIIYNLNLLSFTEMKEHIVTLKVLGFKSNYLTKLLATQSLIFVIIGFIIGIPISYYILTILMPAFGEDIYLIPNISVMNTVFSFIIIIFVTMIMNLYFARKIRKLELVDVLKDSKR